MADIPARMKVRRGTAAQWTGTNPVLQEGEIGFESDTGRFRIGDGVTAFLTLEFYSTEVDAQVAFGSVFATAAQGAKADLAPQLGASGICRAMTDFDTLTGTASGPILMTSANAALPGSNAPTADAYSGYWFKHDGVSGTMVIFQTTSPFRAYTRSVVTSVWKPYRRLDGGATAVTDLNAFEDGDFTSFSCSQTATGAPVISGLATWDAAGYQFGLAAQQLTQILSVQSLEQILMVRTNDGAGWSAWTEILTAANLASFSAPKFTKEYVSPEQTIIDAATTVLAHGLTVAPKLYMGFAVCKTAEHGFVIGQEIPINADFANVVGLQIAVDATNLTCRVGGNGFNTLALSGTGGAWVALTNGNWRYIVRAWA